MGQVGRLKINADAGHRKEIRRQSRFFVRKSAERSSGLRSKFLTVKPLWVFEGKVLKVLTLSTFLPLLSQRIILLIKPFKFYSSIAKRKCRLCRRFLLFLWYNTLVKGKRVKKRVKILGFTKHIRF